MAMNFFFLCFLVLVVGGSPFANGKSNSYFRRLLSSSSLASTSSSSSSSSSSVYSPSASSNSLFSSSGSALTLTQSAIFGPFYVPLAVHKLNAVCDIDDTQFKSPPPPRLTLRGQVKGADGNGTQAVLQVWHANPLGQYSNSSFDVRSEARSGYPFASDCRASISTNSSGHYEFITYYPGQYSDRPNHIHFYISSVDPFYSDVVTQLYFQGDPRLGDNDGCAPQYCHSDDPSLIVSYTSINMSVGSNSGVVEMRNAVWDIVLDFNESAISKQNSTTNNTAFNMPVDSPSIPSIATGIAP